MGKHETGVRIPVMRAESRKRTIELTEPTDDPRAEFIRSVTAQALESVNYSTDMPHVTHLDIPGAIKAAAGIAYDEMNEEPMTPQSQEGAK